MIYTNAILPKNAYVDIFTMTIAVAGIFVKKPQAFSLSINQPDST
jgi:hypothetical protein